MRKEGSQFTCERCGKTAFFEGGGSFNETAGTIKWNLIQGKDFCDTCFNIFNKWFDDFLNGGGEVEVTKERRIKDLESKVRYLHETMENEKRMQNLVDKTVSTFKVLHGME